MKKNQFCFSCGLRVDLRRDFFLANMPMLNANIKNKEYWYIHKKCHDNHMKQFKEM